MLDRCAELWLEGNPLETGSVLPLVERVAQLPAERKLALGLDERQLGALGEERRAAAGKRLRTGTVMGEGRGYWKLSRGPSGAAEDADGTTGARAGLHVGPQPFFACVHLLLQIGWEMLGPEHCPLACSRRQPSNRNASRCLSECLSRVPHMQTTVSPGHHIMASLAGTTSQAV